MLPLQEGSARTGVLRTALASVQESLAELRVDHEALTAAHSKLLAKDLMKSGLLKDRCGTAGGCGWGALRGRRGQLADFVGIGDGEGVRMRGG